MSVTREPLVATYFRAMRMGWDHVCVALEKEHGLYGYSPEMVCVALKAIDEGNDPDKALDDYIDGIDEEDHTA